MWVTAVSRELPHGDESVVIAAQENAAVGVPAQSTDRVIMDGSEKTDVNKATDMMVRTRKYLLFLEDDACEGAGLTALTAG